MVSLSAREEGERERETNAEISQFSQIFHMCDEDGRRIPYMCANETSFNQKFRVCDWNYNVDCASSPDW